MRRRPCSKANSERNTRRTSGAPGGSCRGYTEGDDATLLYLGDGADGDEEDEAMSSLARAAPSVEAERIPPLQNGDRLTAEEFERRYDAMPELKKAELINGVVYMPPPITMEDHGGPH